MSSMASLTKSLTTSHFSLLIHHSKPRLSLSSFNRPFSTTKTPFPLQYDMIISRPSPHPRSKPPHSSDPSPSFESWVDTKLTQNQNQNKNQNRNLDEENETYSKSKRKYYNKRRKQMYGSDSEDEERRLREKEEVVELTQEVVEFKRLHKREEELYFYDAFAFPWEKDKHYKMVYQLEKKYFPNECLDNAFLEPGHSGGDRGSRKKEKAERSEEREEEGKDGMVFFEEGKEGEGGVSEKKVEEFFKCLKKVPSGKDGGVVVGGNNVEPFLASRSSGLPLQWDSTGGTVVLVNKPKGWTSFTVCGKLRRLTKVKKVGHAGTLDPMATGLLIVCVGKSTKVVDRYQGMIKGYSGVFRLGEATSTWDADSPVIQREPWEHIKDEDIKKAAASFTGEIWQVPPMFSAIKVGGEKMYEKARRGESIELAPRRISIFQFDIERSLEDRQNLIFRVTCSKGTYIRSLCADLGKALGSCAHLTALRRDSIGEYTADDAFDFKELEEQITKSYM